MAQSSSSRGRGWRPADFANDFARAARLITDGRVPFALKLLLPAAALAYWVFPLDLIPGLPVDDIAIMLLAVRLFVTLGENAITRSPSAPPWTDQGATGGSASGEPPVVDTTWRVVDE